MEEEEKEEEEEEKKETGNPAPRPRWASALAAAAVSVALSIGGPSAVSVAPANAVSEENLLFLEAWRAVDRAYVDKTFNGSNWFKYREDALRKEPMGDRAETYSAIRRMLVSGSRPFMFVLCVSDRNPETLSEGARPSALRLRPPLLLSLSLSLTLAPPAPRAANPKAVLGDPFTRLLEPQRYALVRQGAGGGAVTGVGLEVSRAARRGRGKGRHAASPPLP